MTNIVCILYYIKLGGDNKIGMDSGKEGQMGEIYIENEDDIYEEEAEQSRLMTAISAGKSVINFILISVLNIHNLK